MDLRYCGDMKTIKTLFLVGGGMDLWYLFPFFSIVGVKAIDKDFSLYSIFWLCGIVLFFRDLFLWKSIIKEVIYNLIIGIEKVKFVSSSTV